jgi:hypothetical protein
VQCLICSPVLCNVIRVPYLPLFFISCFNVKCFIWRIRLEYDSNSWKEVVVAYLNILPRNSSVETEYVSKAWDPNRVLLLVSHYTTATLTCQWKKRIRRAGVIYNMLWKSCVTLFLYKTKTKQKRTKELSSLFHFLCSVVFFVIPVKHYAELLLNSLLAPGQRL